MARFTRAELEEALAYYSSVVDTCSATGDWSTYADLFTEDVHYIEHAYGEFHGREAVRTWIVDVMKPFPHMRFPQEWVAFDEERGAIVAGVKNLLDHPTGDGDDFWFPNWSRMVYAGDHLFSSQEDIYNPARDAERVIVAWLQAGGELVTDHVVEMKHA